MVEQIVISSERCCEDYMENCLFMFVGLRLDRVDLIWAWVSEIRQIKQKRIYISNVSACS